MDYGYEPTPSRPGSLTGAAVVGIIYAILGLLCNVFSLASAALQDVMKEKIPFMKEADVTTQYQKRIEDADGEIAELTAANEQDGTDPAADPEIVRIKEDRERFQKIIDLQSKAERRGRVSGGIDGLVALATNIALIIFCFGALKGRESSRSSMVLISWIKIILVVVVTLVTYPLVMQPSFEAATLTMQDQPMGAPPKDLLNVFMYVGVALGVLVPGGILLAVALLGSSANAKRYCDQVG